MHCPSCQQSLHEQSPACPHCGFDLAAALREFGKPVDLEFPLTDLAGALGPLKRGLVRARLLDFRRAFPQINVAAVVTRLPSHVPLPAHAFWLFNTGGLHAAQETGGRCRLLLLVLDPAGGRAACMIGYGLEPFVSQEALDRIADAAGAALHRGDPAGAILASLRAAREELAAVCRALPRTFGLPEARPAPVAGTEETAYAY